MELNASHRLSEAGSHIPDPRNKPLLRLCGPPLQDQGPVGAPVNIRTYLWRCSRLLAFSTGLKTDTHVENYLRGALLPRAVQHSRPQSRERKGIERFSCVSV